MNRTLRVLTTILMLMILVAMVGVLQGRPSAAYSGVGEVGGAIAGRVLDARSGAPVAGAMVRACPMWMMSSPAQARTSATGEYALVDLGPGNYRLCVELPGYHQPFAEAIRTFELQADERAQNVDLHLLKYGAVAGLVLGENSEPVVNATVRLILRYDLGGSPRLAATGSTQTDDRGSFRFSQVPSGDWGVVVPSVQVSAPLGALISSGTAGLARMGLLGLLSAAGLRPSNDPAFGSQRDGFVDVLTAPASGTQNKPGWVRASVSFPPNLPPSSPDWISLLDGDELANIELQVANVEAFPVYGRTAGLVSTSEGVIVKLEAVVPTGDAAPVPTAVSITDREGRFGFLHVPKGNYWLHVDTSPVLARPWAEVESGPTLWGKQRLTVDGPVKDVELQLRRGIAVQGTLAFEGANPPGGSAATTRFELQKVGSQGSLPTFQSDSSYKFSSVELSPGFYVLRVLGPPSGWRLKSAMLNGEDIAEVPLSVESDPIDSVKVTFTDRHTEISGTVRNAHLDPERLASVYLVTTNQKLWSPLGPEPRRLRIVSASREGFYRVSDLPPGEYVVAAVDTVAASAGFDAKFLKGLSRVGRVVNIVEGTVQTQDLSVVQVPSK